MSPLGAALGAGASSRGGGGVCEAGAIDFTVGGS
jgi:hypothetical protein